MVRRLRIVASGALAAFLGLLPHLLHHIGPLAGAALFAGVGGSLLFGAVGFLAAIPFLVRMRRRSGSWKLPASALALMAIVFSVSTFVIGPAISGGSEGETTPRATSTPTATEGGADEGGGHDAHH